MKLLESFKENLATTASVCTILQFLAGILVCKKIIYNKSTGDSSGLAFVTCFMSCSLWLLYGMLIHDKSIIVVNIFGSTLQLCYAFIYYNFTVKKKIILKQILFATAFVSLIYFYSYNSDDYLTVTRRVGFISCTLTVLFYASPLTMLAHVMRAKSTENLPFPLIISSFIVSCQWFLYGCMLNDYFIQIPNFLGSILCAFQLSLFFVYSSVKKNDQEILL